MRKSSSVASKTRNARTYLGPARQFRKKLLLTISVLVLVPLTTGGWWFGGDTNSSPPSQPGTHVQVWLGEFGQGLYGSSCENNFNATGLADALNNDGSYDDVYGYYVVEGPSNSSGTSGMSAASAYNWGEQQAVWAFNCWYSVFNAGNESGMTIFGDFEYTHNWYTTLGCECGADEHWQANVNVISGFVYKINNLAGTKSDSGQTVELAGLYAGLDWATEYVPNQKWPSNWFVYWNVAGCTAAGGDPGPNSSGVYPSPATYEDIMNKAHSLNEQGQCLFGGQGWSMWQYASSDAVDWDLTPQEGPPTISIEDYYGDEFGGYFITGWGNRSI